MGIAAFGVIGVAAWWMSRPPLRGLGPGFNVLLITLDTTRADRVGCYGYAKASTPTLDALARDGTCFDAAFAQAPLTLPSHATLLTGMYPAELGILDNGRTALPEDVETLAVVFRRQGYRTAAFVAASVLDRRFGLDTGFDLYDDDLPDAPMAAFVSEQQRPGNVVCDRALRWLNDNADSRFFCWVHFFDPHGPYDPPEPYRSRLADPYDGEVAFADAQVKRLIDWLEERGLADRTLIVVAGDHGEGLGDHGESSHAVFLYDSTLRVPLVFSSPGRIPAGRRVTSVVGLVDVFPTLLELVGLPASEAVGGTSFAAAFGDDDLPPRSSYARSDYALDHFGWTRLESVIAGQWKYIQAPRPELYDLRLDPGEEHNLVDERPEVAAAMQAELGATQRRIKARPGRPVAMSDDQLEALRALGYVGGGSSQPGADVSETPKDPKDMVQVVEDYFSAMEFAAQGKPAQAIPILEAAAASSPESYCIRYLLGSLWLEEQNLPAAQAELEAAAAIDPNSSEVHDALGSVYRAQERWPEALAHYRRSLELNPASVKARNNLGLTLESVGEVGAAIDVYRQALHLKPNDARVHNNLGKALLTRGQVDEAIGHFREAIRIHPGYAKAYNNLGAAVARQNQFEEAIECYRQAIGLDPSYSEVRNNLGVVLMKQGKWPEAVEQYEQALHIDSANPAARYNLGVALMRLGRLDEAIDHLTQVVRIAPDRADVYDNLARALVERGRHREAADVLRQAVRLFPEREDLSGRLTELLAAHFPADVDDDGEVARSQPAVGTNAAH